MAGRKGTAGGLAQPAGGLFGAAQPATGGLFGSGTTSSAGRRAVLKNTSLLLYLTMPLSRLFIFRRNVRTATAEASLWHLGLRGSS